MRRVYTDVSAFRAPFRSPNISFAGLGDVANRWPAGRTYYSTHFYRAPYQAGYYQSGALRGDDVPPGARLALYAAVGGALGAGAAALMKMRSSGPALLGVGLGLVLGAVRRA